MFNIDDIWPLLQSTDKDDYELAIGLVRNNIQHVESVDVFLFIFVCYNYNEGYSYPWRNICRKFSIDCDEWANITTNRWYSECYKSDLYATDLFSQNYFQTSTIQQSREMLKLHFPSRIKYIESCLKNLS